MFWPKADTVAISWTASGLDRKPTLFIACQLSLVPYDERSFPLLGPSTAPMRLRPFVSIFTPFHWPHTHPSQHSLCQISCSTAASQISILSIRPKIRPFGAVPVQRSSPPRPGPGPGRTMAARKAKHRVSNAECRVPTDTLPVAQSQSQPSPSPEHCPFYRRHAQLRRHIQPLHLSLMPALQSPYHVKQKAWRTVRLCACTCPFAQKRGRDWDSHSDSGPITLGKPGSDVQ
jgi:hypothetical protein